MQIGIQSPELWSIETLFAGDTRFSVPRYQRSFAWTADEIEELWEDVSGAITRSGEYFLGTIVLHVRPNSQYEIIDGQQRLACITMLFSAIRNVFLAADDKREAQIETTFLGSKGFSKDAMLKPKLTLNKINNETFLQHVLTSEDLGTVESNLKNKGLNPSNRLLLGAYKYFLGKVTQESSKKGTEKDEFLVPLIDTLRTKLKLIAIPVVSDEGANLFFESLNARGKELAISDLVKNRLYLETRDQVNRAEQLWEKMEKDLAKRPVPEFIRHYWIAKKAEKNSPNVREKHLYRMITNDVKGSQSDALALLKDLGESAPDYARISDYSLWPDDAAYDESFEASLRDLRLFRIAQANPLLLNAIQRFAAPSDIAKTFRIVANFAFRYFIIGNQSSGNFERICADIAYEIRANTYTSPKHVADALRAVNSNPTFRSDFGLASEDRARIARYILVKINNHLARESSASGGEQIVNPNAKEVNLEHVYPESTPASWNSAFSPGVNPAEYVYRIGNLTLLRAKLNREQADKSFTDKKTVGLDVSTLKINDYFHGVSTWGDHEIEQRQDGLAKAALEVWKL